MDQDVLTYALGVGYVPFLAFCVRMHFAMADLKKTNDKLIEMHENADKYGFGSTSLTAVTSDLHSAIKELTHYIVWQIKNESGKTPPPPLNV